MTEFVSCIEGLIAVLEAEDDAVLMLERSNIIYTNAASQKRGLLPDATGTPGFLFKRFLEWQSRHADAQGPTEVDLTGEDGQVTTARFIRLPNDLSILRLPGRRAAEGERIIRRRLLDLALDSISQGVQLFDADYRQVAWNRAFEAMGVFPPECLEENYKLFDAYALMAKRGVFGPGGPEAQAREHIDVIKSGNAKRFETIRTPHGRTIEVNRTYLPGGGIAAILTDITDRLATEAELRQAQKLEAIGHLAGGVAHDFNNALAVIIGNLERIRDHHDYDPELDEFFNPIMAAATRSADVTRQILAFSRKEALQPKRLRLPKLLSRMSDMLDRLFEGTIDIDRQWHDGGEIHIDPSLLESAIHNIALNARDAMPDGGTLSIAVTRRDISAREASDFDMLRPGPYVLITMSDTGHGIPKDLLPKVFEPFITSKNSAGGSGLGLSMVHGFMRQSGGHVSIDSTEGAGTAVTLYIPCPAETNEQPPRIADTAPEREHRDGKSVLIIEDNIELMALVENILISFDFEVETACTGQSAIELARNGVQIDAIVSDVKLAGDLNGPETVRHLNAIIGEVPVLYMSGYSEDSLLSEGIIRNGVKLIGKPFRRREFGHAVKACFGG